ncbi:MAG: hypothetical protein BGP11_16115 [Rhodobacterales bacterium 65-51]|uniref:hypothetical protein n=1 Tax=uncultured Gemmobacter sp. TaxID=1095917 RepID=UPI00096994CE|nr:hypothetical protein [uncultured Gemmobacter sp.]OJY34633.1 MAG: hypothetical protein BGP11_16115 [Rhodobacterales bacterium 65-51]
MMRAQLLCLLLSLGTTPSVAQADFQTLICENPRQEYVVKYDLATKQVLASETAYRVLAVEQAGERLVMVGLTTGDGPTFRLQIRPYKKIEFFSDSQLIQTDGCRAP